MHPYQKIVQDIRDLREMDPKDAHALVLKALESVEREPAHRHAARKAVQMVMKRAGKFDPYAKQLKALQATFVGEVGETLHNYVQTLHKRIGKQEKFENVNGFNNWDWGSPKSMGADKWEIRVWLKDSPNLPGDLAGNLTVELTFKGEAVAVKMLDDNTTSLFTRSYPGTDAAPSDIGMNCGDTWEKKLTGSVDYGD